MNAYYMTFDDVAPTANYAEQAIAQFGDGSPDNGNDPELLLGGDSSSSYVGGFSDWGGTTDSNGAWSSDLDLVQLTVTSGGSSKFYDSDSDQTLTAPAETGYISSVELSAIAQTQGFVRFTDVQIAFATNGTDTDVFDAQNGPSVDTSTSSNGSAEQDLVVTPTANTNTSVRISAYVQIGTPGQPYINPSDLMASFKVFSSGN